MTDPGALVQKAQSQTQANRYAFLLKQLNNKLAEKVRKS